MRTVPPQAPDRIGRYRLLDAGAGRRLEAWGEVRLVRPDGRAVFPPRLDAGSWASADAEFEGRVGGGTWRIRRRFAQPWQVELDDLRFEVRCAPSMHTGLFPEQAALWRWLRERTAGRALDVLNLFAYTGGASMALARLGHRVTHVDASRPVVNWARRNAALNGLTTIRWIEEDARRFVDREGRRGRAYEGLVLDPPAFGRGPAGTWQLQHDLPALLDAAIGLLSPAASFIVLNVYSWEAEPHFAHGALLDALASRHRGAGRIDAATLTLTTTDGRELPTGVYARWAADGVAP